MISLQRIWAVVLRHVWLSREMTRLIWLFYWPLLDIFLFGFGGVWMQQTQPNVPGVELSVIAGVVFLQLLNRANFDGSINLIEELWSLNMLNMFATPLRFAEWICAVGIIGIIMGSLVTVYCMMAGWFIYGVNLWPIVVPVIPFLITLFFSGLSLGFFAASIVIYVGARAQSIAFMLGWLFAPFCGALYPLEVMPYWAQVIARFLPMTPAFEGIHVYITSHVISVPHLWMSFIMAISYFVASLTYFAYMFDRSKERGFARLTAD